MNYDAERILFEKAFFPLPSNLTWVGGIGGYAPTAYGAWAADDICQRWKGWIAARKLTENMEPTQ